MFCLYNKTNNDFFKESIIECSFGSDSGCKREFDKYFKKEIPCCYSINGNNNEIFRSYIGGKMDSFSITFRSSDLIYVYLINKTSIKYIDFNIILSPGFMIEASLEKTIEKKLEQPYNDCIQNETTFNLNKTIIEKFIDLNATYSYHSCINICFEIYYTNLDNPCNVTNDSINYLKYFDNDFWFYENKSECIFNKKKLFYKNYSDECAKYCPILCETVNYLVSIRTYKNNELDSNLMYFRFYFTRIQYTLIKQEAKISISDLLANIGGTFSLFLGLSVINLFEITELLFYLINS